MKILLAYGADINVIPSGGRWSNALYCAAEHGLSLTKLLVDNGADMNLACERGTALSVACRSGDQSLVKFLFQSGARVDASEFFGSRPLTLASRSGHKEVVELLIANGADVDDVDYWADYDTTALSAAARSGHTDIVAILIDAGADVSAQGSVALLDALCGGHDRTVALLEARGAEELTLEQLNKGLILLCEYRHRQNFE